MSDHIVNASLDMTTRREGRMRRETRYVTF